MKKQLLLLLFTGSMGLLHVNAQTFTITNLNFPVQHADVSLVDIDGDGDLDILVTGEDGPQKLQLFRNNGTGTFTPSASPFRAITRATIDWNDINQDGKLDLIMNGFSTTGPFDSVYTSDGVGNFTRATSIALPQLTPSTGFADLNNDGFTDIYVFGNFDLPAGKPKIFFNNRIGGFTESAQFNAYNFIDPDVTIIDYDNDRDLDIFVNAFEAISNNRFSKMFRNDGSGNFTVQNLTLIEKGYGSAVWGDFNGDGTLDLLLNGDGGASGEPSSDIYRLYRNNAGVFTAVTTFTPYRQISTGDGGRFLDWDNDGDLDVVITGFNFAESRQATAIFLNNAGVFTPLATNSTIPGVSESSIEVADIDGDTDLDILLTGYSGNNFNGAGSALNSNVTILIRNTTTVTNVAPTPPTGLAIAGNQASLTLSWTAATDLTTPANALSYNIFLVNTGTGKWFYFPLADTTTGKLALQRLGNVNLNRGWIIKNLPAGNYRWGVQAIDNSFMGSTFARSGFTINADGSLPVSLTSFTVKAEGNKAKIQFSTAFEQNNDRFEIERSGDGRKFDKLATLKAKGSANASTDYILFDNNPSDGANYYRLIQFDKDGQSKDLGIKVVNFKTSKGPSVITFPNPAKSFVGIRLSNFHGRELQIVMSDLLGKVVHTETINVNNSQGNYQLKLQQKLLRGQYILKIMGEDLSETLKVIMD